MEIALRDARPAASAGVEATRVRALHSGDPFGEISRMTIATRLITVSHEDEAGMVAKCGDNPICLGIKPRIQWPTVPDLSGIVRPGTAFHLKVKPGLVCGNEGRLGRTPGMEPDMVEPVRLDC